jgi:hypothetical protein
MASMPLTAPGDQALTGLVGGYIARSHGAMKTLAPPA